MSLNQSRVEKSEAQVRKPGRFGSSNYQRSFSGGAGKGGSGTSSAPPNLDEQKRDQARHNSVRSMPTMPIPPVLKQQQMRKDVSGMNQSNTASSHPQPQAKRDIHIPIPAAPAATAQKSSVLPMTGMSMPMPFQQPQVHIQFGGLTPQIQSQGVKAPSLQMLPVGNAAQVQQQVFVPSLQSHPLQPQGMIHQGQSLGFAPQMGRQMVPQLGNLGIGMPPQFAQQQAGKFGAPRKAVKIIHPDTNEELKLDNKRTDSHLDVGSSGPRSHPNVPPQSQPIPSFPPAHSINYYPIPNSYNSVSTSLSASKDRISLEQNRAKGAAGKKKKRREFLLKADAAGTSSDLYMAYKGPEEKPETAITPEIVDSTSDVKQVSADATEKDLLATEDDAQSKAEIDDWEDIVEISSPKLKTLENGEYGSGVSGKKKYSKDFLLTFSEQYTDLPLGFEIGSDMVDAIMSGPVANPHLVERESYPSSGRIIDRPIGGSRPDRRGSSTVDDDKWSKAPGPFASGRDPRLDVGHGGAVINFRPSQCGNHGVLRNPHGQRSGQTQYGSGILSEPTQSLASPEGMARNSPDADRWQCATGIHKGMEAGGSKKKRSIVSRPSMDIVLSSEPKMKVMPKMRKTSEAEPVLAAVITSAPVARPFPSVAMTFSAEAVLVMAPAEAVPIATLTPAPEARAPEAPVGVEPITISTSSAKEQAPKFPPSALTSPSGVTREVVGETPGSVVSVRSVAHYPAAEAELLVGRTDALVEYTTTPKAADQASAASGVGGTSEPTPETLPSGYHMALLNPWAAKHAPEAKIADTLSQRHVNFMNDYAAVCYQSLPMMVEVKERLKEMERLEVERAKFAVEKAELEARRAELEAQRVELEKLLEDSAAEREELRMVAAEGRAKELTLQDEVNQLQARLDMSDLKVKRLWEAVRRLKISLKDVEGDASRLEKDLERVRDEATEGLAQQRTVLEAMAAADQKRLRGELEARAASQVAVAVATYKESAERAREIDKLYFFGYNIGFDTCLAEVKKLHPTIDLDALAADEAENAEPVAADEPKSAPPFVEAGPDAQPPSLVAGPSIRRE